MLFRSALAPEHSNESAVVSLANCVAHAVEDPEGPYMVKVEQLCPEVEIDMGEVMEAAEELFESDDIEQFVKILS